MSFLLKLLGIRPAWARQVDHLGLTASQIERLEDIRLELRANHHLFELYLASDPEAIKRLQRFVYKRLKRDLPHLSEEDLLAKVVANRLAAVRARGGSLFGLRTVSPDQLQERAREIVHRYGTIDALAEAIVADPGHIPALLAVPARLDIMDTARRVTKILAEPETTELP